jgi:hypothetical protein
MPSPMSADKAQRPEPLDPQEEIARLLALNLRISVGNQADTILLLYRAGFGRKRIAELVGTTPGTVNQEIIRYSRKDKRKPLKEEDTTGQESQR